MPRANKAKRGGASSSSASSSSSKATAAAKKTVKKKDGPVFTIPLYARCEEYAGPELYVPLAQLLSHPSPIRGVHKDDVLNILKNVESVGKNTHTPTHPYTETQHICMSCWCE